MLKYVRIPLEKKLLDIVDAKSRVNHDLLMDFVSNNSISIFTEQAQHPFLVGKVLYDGEIKKRTGGADFNTMKFNISDVQAAVDEKINPTCTMSTAVVKKRTRR